MGRVLSFPYIIPSFDGSQVRVGLLSQGITAVARAEGSQREEKIQDNNGAKAGYQYSTTLPGAKFLAPGRIQCRIIHVGCRHNPGTLLPNDQNVRCTSAHYTTAGPSAAICGVPGVLQISQVRGQAERAISAGE